MTYIGLLALLLIQRLGEISQGTANLKRLMPKLVTPLDEREKKQMILLHTLWFVGTLVEYFIHGKLAPESLFMVGILILIWCQYIRFRSMKLLGGSWTQYPIAALDQKIVTEGPYRFIRHPNYLIVILEIAIVLLLGQCFLSAAVFSILNFIFINRRIKIEEAALRKLPQYQETFSMKKKLIPFIFSLLIFNIASAATVHLNYKDFKEASKASTYFKFTSESTKFGLVTTDFEGYAKKAQLDYSPKGNILENLILNIEVKELDTDNSSRNEKMQEECLDLKKHPQIMVTITSLDLSASNQLVDAQMNVRGKSIPLKITITKIDEKKFKGKTSFKLTDAGIPDPSIAIAKVRDSFDIDFQIGLTK